MELQPLPTPRAPGSAPVDTPFDEWFVGALNGAGTLYMCSLAHRTGLFDRMAGRDFESAEEIAERAGLHPRYVRECLGALATGGVVEVDHRDRFRLPARNAAFLTRDAGSQNLAVFSQYLAVMGGVEDDILHCFHHGGGVPYERYPRFHEVMAEDSAMTVLAALEGHILPLVPGLVDRLEEGIDVLDVGCGRGRALLRMAERFPASRFVGMDLSESAVGWARDRAREQGLGNVRFEARDVSDFDRTAPEDAFDLVVTFDAIHDQAHPLAVLKGIARTLRPGGVYLMQDIRGSSHVHGDMDHPMAPFLYTASCLHCTSVSLAQGGEGLGTMWGREQAEALLREAGFRRIRIHELEHDIQNDYYVCEL